MIEQAQVASDPRGGPRGRKTGYVEYYELVEPPFTLTPNPRFVYQSRSHLAAFDEVMRSIERREGLIVVTGEIGTGKTTLSRSVLEQLSARTFASVILNPFLGADDLLKQILTDFGLVSFDSVNAAALNDRTFHELVSTLHRFLASLVPLGAHAVIVIDEAQHLDPQVLEQVRLLSNFETPTEKLLQIILIGQPDLESLLGRRDMRQLAQRVSRRCHLEPLTATEVGRYIDRRLWVAHGGTTAIRTDPAGASKGRPTAAEFWRVRLTPAGVRTVASLSRGIPRVVNLLCDRALEIACEARARAVGSDTVLEAARQLAIPVPLLDRVSRGRPALALAGSALAIAAATGWWWAAPASPPANRSVRQGSPAPAREAATKPAAKPTAAPVSGLAQPKPESAAPVASAPAADHRDSVTAGTLQPADSYLVAVGSFKTRQRANDVMTRAAGLGLPAFIRSDEASGWHVVLVGPYLTREEATAAQSQLGPAGLLDSRIIVSAATASDRKGAQ